MIKNPSFDLLGTQPGLAQDWTLTSSVAARVVALFEDPRTPGYLLGIERFEWVDAVPELISTSAQFAGLAEETFDWVFVPMPTWAEATTGPADFSGQEVDAFDWSAYTPTWGHITSFAATFDALPQETFESWWTLSGTWSSITSVAADFDSEPAETFDDPQWDALDP